MINGVKIKKLIVRQDIPDTPLVDNNQTGFLLEVLRDDDKLQKKFGQTTFTVAYPGTIKAFHWHKKQDDLWFVATGKAKVVLHDLRQRSKTFGQTQVIYAGTDNYQLILIPAGVVHGYQVVGDSPVMLFYHTTRHYNSKNPDEQRLAYNDPAINFDWQKN